MRGWEARSQVEFNDVGDVLDVCGRRKGVKLPSGEGEKAIQYDYWAAFRVHWGCW